MYEVLIWYTEDHDGLTLVIKFEEYRDAQLFFLASQKIKDVNTVELRQGEWSVLDSWNLEQPTLVQEEVEEIKDQKQ